MNGLRTAFCILSQYRCSYERMLLRLQRTRLTSAECVRNCQLLIYEMLNKAAYIFTSCEFPRYSSFIDASCREKRKNEKTGKYFNSWLPREEERKNERKLESILILGYNRENCVFRSVCMYMHLVHTYNVYIITYISTYFVYKNSS